MPDLHLLSSADHRKRGHIYLLGINYMTSCDKLTLHHNNNKKACGGCRTPWLDVPSFLSPSRGSRSAESLCRNWMACFSLLCCLMAAASRTPESRRFSVRITVYMPSRWVCVCGRLRFHLRGPVTMERTTTTTPGDVLSSAGERRL